MTNNKFPIKFKVILGLIALIVISVTFKIMYSHFSAESESILSQSEIVTIRGLLTEECLKQEETSLNKGNNLDEDLEWFKNKAPEYCKCVSLKIYSLVLQEGSLKELLVRREKREFNQKVLSFMKSDKSKGATDFCLSKAQKMSTAKRTYASEGSAKRK